MCVNYARKDSKNAGSKLSRRSWPDPWTVTAFSCESFGSAYRVHALVSVSFIKEAMPLLYKQVLGM